MRLTFRAKLLASYVSLVAAVVLLAILQLNRSLTANLERQVDERLEQQASGAAQWVGEGGHRHTDRLASRIASTVKAEVTIYDREGKIVGETSAHPAAGEPDQPELVLARRGEVGRATRVRDGTGEELHYVAVPTAEGYVLRLATPLWSVRSTVGAMRAELLLATLVAFVAACALAFLASRFASRPLQVMTEAASRIANGDYSVRLEANSPDEFGHLARALNTVAAKLEERTTMRGDYMANLSHELRTPVSAIEGSAETLLHERTSPEMARRFLETIHRQARRIADLTEEIFALAELEARPAESIRLEAVNVGDVARLVADTLRGAAGTESATVIVEESANVEVMADPEGLERVLQNLVDNALKYGRPSGEVRVSAARKDNLVVIAVADDGPGIPPEHLSRVFERFYRVDPARSRERGGSGLGLAIAKHHVALMGGDLRVESPAGDGAHFFAELRAVS